MSESAVFSARRFRLRVPRFHPRAARYGGQVGGRVGASGLVIACLLAAADTGAQSTAWRQCLTDTSPAAVDACTSVIKSDPRNDGAFVNRGIAYRRLGDFDRAIKDYDEAIRLNPRAADAYNNRGNAYRALDDLDRARRDYDEAIRLNPRYAHAFNNRGIVLLELGEIDLAMEDFDKAIAEDPQYANALRNRALGRVLRQLDGP